MCDIDWSVDASVWNVRNVTARKPHACSCCGGTIASGELYIRHFSVHDGSPCSEKMCRPCAQISDLFAIEHKSTGVPSYMPQLLRECIDAEGADSEPGKRWTSALGEMRARRAERKGGGT